MENLTYLEIFLILIFLFFFLKRSSIRKTKSRNLAPFGYFMFYTDQKAPLTPKSAIKSKILYSEKYNLTGKPDYIYKKGKVYYPVELKSGSIGNNPFPHEGDFFQLIAYFLIIEDLYGVKVKKGKLIYSDYSFIIKNTKKNKRKLLKILKKMRTMLKTGKDTPVCNFAHCNYCICKQTVCEYYNKKG